MNSPLPFLSRFVRSGFVATATLLTGTAGAQETLDVGILQNQDISVVQKVLFPKAGRNEIGLQLGAMAFDPFTSTPIASISYTHHLSETLGFEGTAGGGYSFKTRAHKVLESPSYAVNVVPDAYRHLGHVLGAVQYSPIYAKFNWKGKRVLHHDMYGLAGAGASLEQAWMPDADTGISPMGSLGIGARVFLKNNYAVRLQLRDDLLWQERQKTEDVQTHFLKQNVSVSVGISKLGDKS